MIFSSSARWPRACTGASAHTRRARVAQRRRTPFLSDMSDSEKARADSYGQLLARLDAKRLKRNEPLAQYTTFKIGGPADRFYDATSVEDLALAVTAARVLRLVKFFLGLCANNLIRNMGFRGPIL